MMQGFRLFSGFSIILLFLVIIGCYTVENDLEGLTAYNAAEKDSGEELIDVDSVYATGRKIEFFFHVNWSVIGDTSNVHRIRVYRDGSSSIKELSPGVYDYFIDINVVANVTYTYQFAILNEDREVSKRSKKYIVTAN